MGTLAIIVEDARTVLTTPWLLVAYGGVALLVAWLSGRAALRERRRGEDAPDED